MNILNSSVLAALLTNHKAAVRPLPLSPRLVVSKGMEEERAREEGRRTRRSERNDDQDY